MATQDYAITNTLLQSLFGPSPDQQAQAYQQTRNQQALQMAQLTPGRGAVYAGSQIASDLGQSAQQLGGAVRRGVFGIETPKEIEDNVANQIKAKAQPLLQQGDTAAYADFLAQEYSKAGLTDRALRAKTAAEQFKSQAAERGANIAFKEAQAEQMRAKAAGGGKDDRSPEKKKMDELIEQGVPTAEARAIAYKTQSVDFRRELAAEKEEDRKRSLLERQQSTITTIDNVVNKVDEATKQVSPYTAGAGSIFSVVPGTPAKDLASTIETIKANLGFDRLQRMRDASPTGGALGQVAVQELVALQASVASLDVSQSPAQLKKNLENVKRHYQNWRKAILDSQAQGQQPQGAQGGEVQRPSAATPPIAPEQGQKPVVRFVRDSKGNIVRQ